MSAPRVMILEQARREDLMIIEMGLNDAWRPIASTLLARAVAKGIALRALLPTSDRTFAADRSAISHILLNLVINAINFTPTGGSIYVGQEDVEGRPDELALYVRDTAWGTPPDKATDMLKPFMQVSDSYVRDGGDIGLGLAICKSLAEAMGGRIAIESQLGKGTTARVFLPARRQPSIASARERSGSQPIRRKRKALWPATKTMH